MASVGDAGLLANVYNALDLATQHARNLVKSDGHWLGPMSSDVTITAEWIFLIQSLNLPVSVTDRQAYRHHFLSSQQPDGSWAIAPRYPHGGNLSATIEAYLALKILGLPIQDPAMTKARAYVLAQGGVEKMRIFTRFHLAMFGLLPWAAVPQMPPELILLPSWFPINMFRFSSWARITIVPFLVIRTREPIYALPNGRHVQNDFLDELWCNSERKLVPYTESFLKLATNNPVALLFQIADFLIWLLCLVQFVPLRAWALRRCVDWLKTRQEDSGDWAGIFPPMHLSIYALLLEGHTLEDDAVRRGLGALNRFCYQTEEQGRWMQPCVSPVWDTFLMVRGLLDARTVETDDELLTRGLEWTVARQITTRVGDWHVRCPTGIPGGFSFEYSNTWYPDVDDTAAGILSFIKQDPNSLTSSHVLRAAAWVLKMQNRDGGWAAFDVDNDALFLNSIPFSDMDALCDPSSADIVGRVLEAFSLMLEVSSRNQKAKFRSGPSEVLLAALLEASNRGITYLEATQEPAGAWYGRWGANYIYGTSNVLCGLMYFTKQPRVKKMVSSALRWLESVQNEDGGWGEGLDSYIDSTKGGIGPSTPSQTAWALMALLAHLPADTPAITNGIQWLVSSQVDSSRGAAGEKPAATWKEDVYTGTGFPGHFYLGYALYSHYFPLMALGRYARATCPV
ncbi:putative squalene-hopene-cyclase [Thozetella sp. PMI_491]|nr:putative squalene-hopene-cyclase [Thozetella sp. PMI_491]